MRLTRLFALSTAALIALIGLLLLRVLYVEWSAYNASRAGLEAMQLAYKAMVAAEKASVERGPTNGVLGDGDTPDAAKQARLALARTATDTAFSDLQAALAPDGGQRRLAARLALDRARAQLIAARGEVDQVARLQKSGREPERVMGAVRQMFDVIPILMETVTLLSRDAEEIYPQFADSLMGARLAAELREHAGRLGSQFTAALTEQKPLAAGEQREIQVLRGRIEQLRNLIELPTRARETDPRIIGAVRAMERRYFVAGLVFIAEVERMSAAATPYGMDTAQFAARYVPEMASILQLRDVLIGIAIEGGRARQAEARQTLLLSSLLGATALVLVALIFLAIRRRVVTPLLQTTRTLTEIAQGNLATEVPVDTRGDEIGAMRNAVALLRQTSLERRRLEEERDALIEELKQSSSTDFLTGLLNRRAFANIVQAQIAASRRHGWPLGLILFDLDHFKSVNDQYGHDAGDTVLAEVASIARATFREEDFIGRHGGEEFVVLAPHCEMPAAHALAERLRATLEMSTINLPDGRELRITASFGVASLRRPADSFESLLRGADRALYAAKGAGRNQVMDAQAADKPAPAPAPSSAQKIRE